VALDPRVLDLDRRDSREPRAVMQEGDELLNGLVGTLGMNPYRAVRPVSHPAHQPEVARPANRRIAEADAVHIAVDGSANRGPGGLHHRHIVTPGPGRPGVLHRTALGLRRPAPRAH